jgi:hypothetical protein
MGVRLRSGVTAQGQSQTRDALGKINFQTLRSLDAAEVAVHSQVGRISVPPPALWSWHVVLAVAAGGVLWHSYDRLRQGKRSFACAIRFS